MKILLKSSAREERKSSLPHQPMSRKIFTKTEDHNFDKFNQKFPVHMLPHLPIHQPTRQRSIIVVLKLKRWRIDRHWNSTFIFFSQTHTQWKLLSVTRDELNIYQKRMKKWRKKSTRWKIANGNKFAQQHQVCMKIDKTLPYIIHIYVNNLQ